MRVWSWALGAHLAWKPLLVVNAAFLLCAGLRSRPGRLMPAGKTKLGAAFVAAVFLLTVLVYLPSLGANFVRFDWTHRVTTEHVTSAARLGYFFTAPQPDRFYRPLTFVSLWVDNRLFGSRLWPYHLQNIAVHAANAVLAGLLAAGLGLSRTASRFTALLFGLGAVRFEAVVWPGARFDLLATLFSLIGLLAFLRFLRVERAAPLWGAAVVFAYGGAVLSKETGYSMLLVIPLLAATGRVWGLSRLPEKRVAGLTAALVISTAILIGIRFALFGGIGGYPAPQAAFDLRTVYLFVRNALAASVFGLNDIPHSAWPLLIALAFTFVMLAACVLYRGADRPRLLALAALTLVAAIPAVNLIGWLNPGFENSRYLYWPSLWTCLLLALVFEAARGRAALMCAFLAVQAAGTLWNENVYRDLSSKAGLIAAQVRHDAAGRRISTVQFQNVGTSEDGVFAFGPELAARTTESVPGVKVETCGKVCAAEPGTLVYRWDEGSRTMKRTH